MHKSLSFKKQYIDLGDNHFYVPKTVNNTCKTTRNILGKGAIFIFCVSHPRIFSRSQASGRAGKKEKRPTLSTKEGTDF